MSLKTYTPLYTPWPFKKKKLSSRWPDNAFRGIKKTKRHKDGSVRWRVNVSDGKGVQHHIGYFDDYVVALIEYDKAAKKHIGEKAILNFRDEFWETI